MLDQPSQLVQASLIAEQIGVSAGQPFTVGLFLTIAPDWHVYWKNPGDSGLPTLMDWDLPSGFKAEPMQWPTPERIVTQGLTSYGYSNQILLPVRITPPSYLRLGTTVTLHATVHWLACKVECVPGTARLGLSLSVVPSVRVGKGPQAALFGAAQARMPAIDPRVRFSAKENARHVRLMATGLAVTKPQNVVFYPDTPGVIQDTGVQAAVMDGAAELRLDRQGSPGPLERLTGILLLDDTPGQQKALLVDVPVAVDAGASGGVGLLGGVLAAIALGLVGGLLLNLMPCVLPVISIKVMSLARQAGGEGPHAARNGLIFGLGVLVSFWIIAAILITLRAGGRLLGWGFQLQNPVVVIIASVVFFLIGLNLFGVFEVGAVFTRLGSARSQGAVGAFFSGLLATAVATPCTAPFMGVAVGYALSHSSAAAFGVFTALGIGMAAPYVMLSAFPVLLARLPKPGAWMQTLRQILGFPMMAAVIWMVFVLAGLASMGGVVALLAGMLVAGIGAWVWGTWGTVSHSTRARVAAGIAGIALVIAGPAGAMGFAGSAQVGVAVSTGYWQPWSAQKVKDLTEEGRPILIDFTARWCLTCQVNERVALENAAVKKRLSELGVATLRADWTDQDPAIAGALEGYGRASVPLYVLYIPGAPAPVLLPEILTPGVVLGALDQVGKNPSP